MLGRILKWALSIVVTSAIFAGATVMLLQQQIPKATAGGNARLHDPRYAAVVDQVSSQLDTYRASLVSPSLSVAVGVNGDLVWADTRGVADIETQTPATPDTVYAIGSVSKPISAVLTARLWQQGVLDIDADLRDEVPGFPLKSHAVTPRQLLSHQAGIRHYRFRLSLPTFSEQDLNQEFEDTPSSLSLFADEPLLFPPDTDFSYSTFGYTLLTAVIEQATGQPFVDALDRNVLEPLAMTQTSIDQPGKLAGRRAADYVSLFSKSAVLSAPATNSSYKWAGGGLASTPSDLVRLGNAMLDDSVLTSSTRQAMFSPRTLAHGEPNPQRYGLGWRIGGLSITDQRTGEESVIPLWHHGGARAGSTAVLMVVPEHKIVVAMCANSVGRGGSGPLTSAAAKVARAFIAYDPTGLSQ